MVERGIIIFVGEGAGAGSVATGKKIMRAAAETLKPVRCPSCSASAAVDAGGAAVGILVLCRLRWCVARVCRRI